MSARNRYAQRTLPFAGDYRVYTRQPLDQTGLYQYLHLVRSADDPGRRPRPPGGQADRTPHRTFNKKTAAHWKTVLLAHMSDGVPRTFNRMCVELWDKTADVVFTTTVNDALIELVNEERLEHTLDLPILFRLGRDNA